MLTPQEVSEHAFAKATFGGYNMTMVDEFLDLLTSDYTALYNENAVLKKKLKVVSDKVEEYRATEDEMRKTLMLAQRRSDEMVQEAEQEKQTILQQAQAQAEERISGIRQEARDEEYRLSAARKAASAFVDKLRQLYQQELEYLDRLSQMTAPPATGTADRVDQTAQEIENNVQRILAEEIPAQPAAQPPRPAEPEEEPEDEEEEDAAAVSPTRRINLDRLEFGRNYEIK